MKETDYERQGTKFLEDTGTTMTTKLLGERPFFEDDKAVRDVYLIKLVRGARTWEFEFGQSIANSRAGLPKNRQHYAAMEWAKLQKNVKPPTSYDVLACITKHDPGTFTEFCNAFGYSTDSMTAFRVYSAVQDEYTNVSGMFGDVMDRLWEIQ